MDDELKALLAKAEANYIKLQAQYDALVVKFDAGVSTNSEMRVKMEDQLVKSTADQDEMRNLIADLEVKIKSGGRATDDVTPAIKELAIKSAIGEYVRNSNRKQLNGNQAMDFKEFVVNKVKSSLNLSESGFGAESVDNVLSRDIIERARETYTVLGEVGMRNMPRQLREEVLVGYPNVTQGIENVAGTQIAETDVQEYREVENQIAKLFAQPRMTDESMQGSDLDLYAHLVDLLTREIGIYIALQVLFGNGASKNMRGILSSNRLDITNLTGQSWKPTLAPVIADARDVDFYPAFATNVAGGLPATDVAKVNWLIDMVTALPTAYKSGAKWHMNKTTLALFWKIRDADERPIFAGGFMGEGMSILGYPVVIDDAMPNVAVNAPFLIFGKLNEAFYMGPGDIDKMLPNPYKIPGCTLFEYHKEMLEIVGKNDAIIIGVATTNGPA